MNVATTFEEIKAIAEQAVKSGKAAEFVDALLEILQEMKDFVPPPKFKYFVVTDNYEVLGFNDEEAIEELDMHNVVYKVDTLSMFRVEDKQFEDCREVPKDWIS